MPGSLRRLNRRLFSAAVALLIAGCALAVVQPASAPAATTFSVLTFGAQPNDNIDDTAAIQAAIDAAAAVGGSVTIPEGTFRVTNYLYPASNVCIVGTAGRTILYMPPRASLTCFFYGSGLHNVVFQGITLRADSTADNVHGIAMYGAINCRISDMRLENLGYGLKLGSGPVASGWLIENLTARNCKEAIFAMDVADSRFIGLDLAGCGLAGTELEHCIYLAKECRRLVFKNVNLTSPSGYALHLWNTSGGTSSDVTFENVTMDATNGRWPLVIGDGWSNVVFRNVSMKMRPTTYAVCVRLAAPTSVSFDGFTASGGYALFGTFTSVSEPAQGITFRNGSYTGPSLQPSDASERKIVGLVMDNVVLNPGTGSTTTRSTTSTTLNTTTTNQSTTTTRRTTTTTSARTTTTTNLPQPVDTGEVARFVLLTGRTWQTVLVPLTTYSSPDTPVARVEFLLGDQMLRVDIDQPFICWLDTRDIVSGTYTLHATAFDSLGNVCASGSAAISL